MLKLGLTGGIGVGKTIASDCFQKLGVPVIDTDVIAHDLVTPGSDALMKIIATFGHEVLNDQKELNRKRLSQIVFSNPRQRHKLETILHPKIKEAALKQVQDLNTSYCVLVVPLLIETDFVELVDRILVVDAPDDKRIKWIKDRSELSESEITRIIAAQTSREKRLAAADYVIVNDGSIAELENKVLEIHHKVLSEIDSAL